GTDGILACGTTGEDPGLLPDEHERVVENIVATAAGRVLVMVGTGSNSTAHTIELTKHAERARANAALVVSPYYHKPTHEGLYRHLPPVPAGAPRPPLPRGRRGHVAADLRLQHPEPDGGEHRDADARAYRARLPDRRRCQGSVGLPRPDESGHRRLWPRLRRAVGRRQPDP